VITTMIACDWCGTSEELPADQDKGPNLTWEFENGNHLCPECLAARKAALVRVENERRALGAKS